MAGWEGGGSCPFSLTPKPVPGAGEGLPDPCAPVCLAIERQILCDQITKRESRPWVRGLLRPVEGWSHSKADFAAHSLNSYWALQGLECPLCSLFRVLCPCRAPTRHRPVPARGLPLAAVPCCPCVWALPPQQLAHGSRPEVALAGTPGPVT